MSSVAPVLPRAEAAAERRLLGLVSEAAPDEALVALSIEGVPGAFDVLVSRHHAVALRTAATILGMELAEDAVQDALVLALQALPMMRDPSRFGRWLSTITRFRALRLLRSERSRRAATVPLDESLAATLSDLAFAPREEGDGDGQLLVALAEIPPEYGEVLRLHFLHGVPHRRIAALLGVSLATVKWRCYRGKDMLRRALLSQGCRNRIQAVCADCADSSRCPAALAETPRLAERRRRVRAAVDGVSKGVVTIISFIASFVFDIPLPGESKAPASVIRNGTGAVTFLRYSPDGRELARVCQEGLPELFDTLRFKRARTFSERVRQIAYAPGGAVMVTAEGPGGARVWDASSPGEPMPYLPPVVQADRYLLSTPIKILQAPSPEPAHVVNWVEFSSDGKWLVTAHGDGVARIWSTGNWEVALELPVADVGLEVAVFHPDGKTLVFGDAGGQLHEWSLEGELRTIATVGPVLSIAWSPDAKTLVTVHRTKSTRSVAIWDTATWRPEVRIGYSSATFSRDGRVLALGGKRIELVAPGSRKLIRAVDLPALTLREVNPQQYGMVPGSTPSIPVSVVALAPSPDGHTLAAGMEEGTVRLVDLER